jgi:protein TonB
VSPASPVFLRAAFLGTSAAAHALVFVAMGHPPQAARQTDRDTPVVVEADSNIVLVEPTESENVTNQIALLRPPTHTHTHPYPVPPDHDAVPHDPSLVHLPIPGLAAHRSPQPITEAPPALAQTLPSPAAPRFTLTVGAAPATNGSAVSPTSALEAPVPGGDAAPLAESEVSSPARLLGSITPAYPPEAIAQEIESNVVVSIVVTTAGAVADAQLVKRAGYGLDEAVLRAVRGARFLPAQREGRPVAVRMRVTVSFALR